jgi:hypothetical protein
MASVTPAINRRSLAFWAAFTVLMIFATSILALWLARTLVDMIG